MAQMLDLLDLLQHEIDDLYSAEEQIIEALPKMVENASNPELKRALNQHLQITREQKKRLDQVKSLLEKEGSYSQRTGLLQKIFGTAKCKGTEGLIKEGEHLMKQEMDTDVKDAAIIAAAQKIEHYEISSYGTARAYAMQLKLSEIESLLATTLQEEHEADNQLSALAFFDVNIKAEAGHGGVPAEK